MEAIAQGISNLIGLWALGLIVAAPFIGYAELRDRRKARRIERIARLRAAVNDEVRQAFEALAGEDNRAARAGLHTLNIRIQSRLGARLTEAQ